MIRDIASTSSTPSELLNRVMLRAGLPTRGGIPFSRTRIVLAVKAALAALLAWYTATLVLDDITYPYYAPLGAMLAMNFSVAASVRESTRAIGAIALGLAIAVACSYVLGTSAFGVAFVVGLGVVVAGWRRLGASASWVPTSALFVLILAGDSNIVEYVSSYGGLTLLGMVIGVVVNVSFPAHPLARFDPFADRVRHRLAGQLDAVAEGLGDGTTTLSDADWQSRRSDMLPLIAEVRAATQETLESTRANPRARWHRTRTDSQYAQARLLERATLLTEELTQLVSEGERTENRALALGPDLCEQTGLALRAIAVVLRQPQAATPEDSRRAVADAHGELRGLESALWRTGQKRQTMMLHAGGIATALRRNLHTVAALACEGR